MKFVKIKKLLEKFIPVLLVAIFCFISITSITAIKHMEGNARVINYAGIVRGATQRLIKQEMNGYPNDELIVQLDEIITGLAEGDDEKKLIVLEDEAFQSLIAQMRRDWTEIKSEIIQHRKTGDKHSIYTLSEDYFELANDAVSAAEQYSESQVMTAKEILFCLNICFILLAVLFFCYGRRQKKVQMALDVAEHSNKAKSRFLSHMSHEIRTPLNGIIGMTEIAHMHFEDRERVDDCLKKIELSSKYLLVLINDILDMSRIESGKAELKNQAFDINIMIEQIYGMFYQKAKENGIDFCVENDEVFEPRVIGDELKLCQILVNIVSNAMKFTPSGGRVTLAARQRDNEDEEISTEFIITDTGIGISEEFQSRIFEPFEQENNMPGKKYGGTGLGLAISSNFVKMMGGKISVFSRIGEGSQFIVDVTLKKFLAEDDEYSFSRVFGSDEDTNKDITGAKILLAEDNEINAEIVKVILENYGADVYQAHNGREVIDMIAKSDRGFYSLILMDIQMPLMGGLEATSTIRSMERSDTKTIPIIGLSANAFVEDVEKAIQSGMNGYLAKPIDITKLMETIRKFC